MALRHLQRLVRAAPLVALASATHCSPENHFAQAIGNIELLEILMAGTKTPVPADLASSIVEHHHTGDKVRVQALVDQAIARGANADAALLAAYFSRDQVLISHLLVGRTTVPPNSIRYIVSGEYNRWQYSRLYCRAKDNVALFARIRDAVALGADPSAPNPSQRGCALVTAVEMNNAALVQLLLELGADPAGVGPHGRSALWLAINNKRPAIVRMLLNASDVRTQ